jgi:uncharacterized protein YlxW (UPF0749 family)
MPTKSDNDDEREDRIMDMVRRIRHTQERVERLAAEGRRRAEEIAATRAKEPRNAGPSTRKHAG